MHRTSLKDDLRDIRDRAQSYGLMVVVLAGSVLAGFFFACMAVQAASDTYMAHVASKDWPSTHATVEQAFMAQDCGGWRYGSRYSLHVVYAYEVGDQRFRNDRLWFGNALCTGRSEVESRLNGFPLGSRMFVHYDPQQPSRSVAFRGGVENGTVASIFILASLSLACLSLPIKVLRDWARDRKREQESADEATVYRPRMHDAPVRQKVDRKG